MYLAAKYVHLIIQIAQNVISAIISKIIIAELYAILQGIMEIVQAIHANNVILNVQSRLNYFINLLQFVNKNSVMFFYNDNYLKYVFSRN